ncbi:hypothetical protein CDAR_288691 [Caerostris darwini]|uniref:Uncharacterized protein n=1 Tax=Caerostris darwini TaxID=1538125 RepID=A0AAV4RP62_9ARAC|nr:hypothetical protein CDAR_288691 [Caerostris darwini]
MRECCLNGVCTHIRIPVRSFLAVTTSYEMWKSKVSCSANPSSSRLTDSPGKHVLTLSHLTGSLPLSPKFVDHLRVRSHLKEYGLFKLRLRPSLAPWASTPLHQVRRSPWLDRTCRNGGCLS